MKFPTKYKCLGLFEIKKENYKLVPIRYEDRLDIMKWRNEQMYHLRQEELLTESSQDKYFNEVIARLFEQEKPNQILFSYLRDDKCIGYGGLVHIDWKAKTAEISFIMDTQLEKEEFSLHWSNFLNLLKKVAFDELNFNSIFTYAYNLRPHLYPVLEANQFVFIKRLSEEIEVDNKKIDVLIHQCNNPWIDLSIRKCDTNDLMTVFNWSNDQLVRSQSFNSKSIDLEEHKVWFNKKNTSDLSLMLINEFKGKASGLVRFDLEKGCAVIGILIDKKYRGMGLSSLMLRKSIDFYYETNKQPILAYIKKENKASIRAFEKAGFSLFKEELRENSLALIYKFDKNERK